MKEYRSLITSMITMTSFTNADILNIAIEKSGALTKWIEWYKNLYNPLARYP